MARSIALVFIDDYSEKLEGLAFRTAVWIVDTPANRSAAEGAWHAAMEWPRMSVTLFRFDGWPALLTQISFQVGGIDSIDVIGTPLTLAARAALADAAFSRVDEQSEGFRARKG